MNQSEFGGHFMRPHFYHYLHSTSAPDSTVSDISNSPPQSINTIVEDQISFPQSHFHLSYPFEIDCSSLEHCLIRSEHQKGRSYTFQKRRAANMRERKRMKSMNHAFEFLRKHIPLLPYEKRMSKVETLKLATWYISFLNEMVTTGRNPNENTKKIQHKAQKVVIKCHRPGSEDVIGVPVLHSLSCQFESNPYRQGNIIFTKLWTPEDPRTNDCKNNLYLDQECSDHSKDDNSHLSSHHHHLHSSVILERENRFSLDSNDESFQQT